MFKYRHFSDLLIKEKCQFQQESNIIPYTAYMTKNKHVSYKITINFCRDIYVKVIFGSPAYISFYIKLIFAKFYLDSKIFMIFMVVKVIFGSGSCMETITNYGPTHRVRF